MYHLLLRFTQSEVAATLAVRWLLWPYGGCYGLMVAAVANYGGCHALVVAVLVVLRVLSLLSYNRVSLVHLT